MKRLFLFILIFLYPHHAYSTSFAQGIKRTVKIMWMTATLPGQIGYWIGKTIAEYGPVITYAAIIAKRNPIEAGASIIVMSKLWEKNKALTMFVSILIIYQLKKKLETAKALSKALKAAKTPKRYKLKGAYLVPVD